MAASESLKELCSHVIINWEYHTLTKQPVYICIYKLVVLSLDETNAYALLSENK